MQVGRPHCLHLVAVVIEIPAVATTVRHIADLCQGLARLLIRCSLHHDTVG